MKATSAFVALLFVISVFGGTASAKCQGFVVAGISANLYSFVNCTLSGGVQARPAKFEEAMAQGASRRLLSKCNVRCVFRLFASKLSQQLAPAASIICVHMQHDLLTFSLFAEAIDVPWGVPASFNASGRGSVTVVDHNTSRYRDVAAVVGDTVTIHWNSSAGSNYSLWQIPSGWCRPARGTLTAVQSFAPLP